MLVENTSFNLLRLSFPNSKVIYLCVDAVMALFRKLNIATTPPTTL